MALIDLLAQEIVDANQAALDFFATRDSGPVDLNEHIPIDARWHRMVEYVLAGTVDGFEAQIPTRAPGVQPHLWVRALVSKDEPRHFAVAVLTEGGDIDPPIPVPMMRSATMVAGAVDGEWMCDWVTREVRGLLGYPRDEFVGIALLALASPDIAAELVTALARASDSEGGAVIRGRLRRADRKWRRVEVIVSPRPEHPGAMFLLFPERAHGRRDDEDAEMMRVAGDAHAAALATRGDWPAAASPDLSSRQWEIVTRLQRGERVADIAAAMYLSPSTVRNHLAAVFRKFAVHSQIGLLAALRSTS